MRWATVFVGALISFTFTGVLELQAAEFGTREEAIAMVQRVQEKFKKEGIDATVRAANAKAPGFIDRDLYVMIYAMDGTCLANGQTPAVRNKNLYELKDQDGKYMIQDFIRTATNPPFHGWVDYRWPNAGTKSIEDKSTWVERMGDYMVGVGVYKLEQPNEKTVGIISGSPNSDDTYLQMANDLAEVLNDGDNLRILPVAGVGGPRNIRDVRYLRGIDVGLTQTNILNNFRRSNERMGQTDSKPVVYIAKLFNEEVHLLARADINSIEDLRGKKVNLDAKGSGTSYSMRDLFKTYDIEVVEESMSQLEAVQKLKSGDIAATAVIAGKPVRTLSFIRPGEGLHFVPLPYPATLIEDYMPAALRHEDYPNLVPDGETVDTVAVGAVMIAVNWPRNSDRYTRVAHFVESFFSKITALQKPPRHPKWREVNLAATLPNWTRLPAAQEWLQANQHAEEQRVGAVARAAAPAADRSVAPAAAAPAARSNEGLFRDFMTWQRSLGGR